MLSFTKGRPFKTCLRRSNLWLSPAAGKKEKEGRVGEHDKRPAANETTSWTLCNVTWKLPVMRQSVRNGSTVVSRQQRPCSPKTAFPARSATTPRFGKNGNERIYGGLGGRGRQPESTQLFWPVERDVLQKFLQR